MLEDYLGDGVYATFDGYQIWLDCRGQSGFSIGPGGRLGIALEPPVLSRLVDFARRAPSEYIEKEPTP